MLRAECPSVLVTFLATACICVTPAPASGKLLSDSYQICPKGLVYDETRRQQQQPQQHRQQQPLQPRRTLSVRGKLGCLAECSRNGDCRGVNVCPTAAGRDSASGQLVSCTTLVSGGGTGAHEDRSESACDELTAASDPLCFYAKRKSHVSPKGNAVPAKSIEETTPEVTQPATTPLPLFCQNGGTPNAGRCNCSLGYGGRTCHRPIRDCTEAYENGHRSALSIPLCIQPVNAPRPFPVACRMATSGSATTVFQRTKSSRISVDWDTYKRGIGSDPDDYPFFIGLDSLHYLTSQASYRIKIWVLTADGDDGEAVYVNFTVGPESSSYTLRYDQFLKTGSPDDGFSSSRPIKFSAAGNDVNDVCFNKRGKAGWYGTNCSGEGMFTKGTFNWPFNGQTAVLYGMNFMLNRISLPFED